MKNLILVAILALSSVSAYAYINGQQQLEHNQKPLASYPSESKEDCGTDLSLSEKKDTACCPSK